MPHLLFAFCTFLLVLTSCGGGGADAKLSATTVSQGQELMDLQKARDSGAITEQEYEVQKSKILKR
jgi:hypothetical protein